jgi:hypothetical protein
MRAIKRVMFIVNTTNPTDDLSDLLVSGGTNENFTGTKWDCSDCVEFNFYIKLVENE